MRSLPFLLALLAVPLAGAAEVTVSVDAEGLVDLRTTGAPLSDVLDRFGAEAGVAIVYDGPKPRVPVAADLKGATPREAVTSLFEGLASPLNYVVLGDRAGLRVDRVLVVGSGPSRPGSAPPVPPAVTGDALPEEPPPAFDVQAETEPAGEAIEAVPGRSVTGPPPPVGQELSVETPAASPAPVAPVPVTVPSGVLRPTSPAQAGSQQAGAGPPRDYTNEAIVRPPGSSSE